jgi:beta-phosphoglucomutase
MFEGVIFDWDGTLADTRKVIVASFQKTLRELDCEIPDEFVERRIGIGTKQTFVEILMQLGVRFDDAMIERLLQRKIAAELEMEDSVTLFKGAQDLLDSLAGKVKLALASMNNREVIDAQLKMKRILKFFDVVVTADDISEPKPNPEIFLKASAKLGFKPEKCVVVEDSIFGVKAAKNAGMGCVAVLTGVYSRKELKSAKPDLVVSSLKEKAKIVRFCLS